MSPVESYYDEYGLATNDGTPRGISNILKFQKNSRNFYLWNYIP